jgi:hypothetical protein
MNASRSDPRAASAAPIRRRVSALRSTLGFCHADRKQKSVGENRDGRADSQNSPKHGAVGIGPQRAEDEAAANEGDADRIASNDSMVFTASRPALAPS